MWRSSLKAKATFRNFGHQLRAASFNPVETYPHRVPSHLRSLIKDSDLVGVFGEYKHFRARPDHNVLLKNPLNDFFLNESSCKGVGVKPHDEIIWPFLYNCTRYPFSFFTLNKNEEIVNLALQEVVYRDNSKDPLPRMEIRLSNPTDPFHLVGAVLGWAEHRHFELLPDEEKLLHSEIAYVPSVLRRNKISSFLYPATLKESVNLAPKYGLKWNVGVVTSNANKRNMAKFGYQSIEEVPKEVYKDFDGNSWAPAEGEERALLGRLDMVWAREKKIFE